MRGACGRAPQTICWHYDEKDMLAFDELIELENRDGLADLLPPIASAFEDWSEILIDPGQARLLKNGAKLAYRFGKKVSGWYLREY